MSIDWREVFVKNFKPRTTPKWRTPLRMAQAFDVKVKIIPALHGVDLALARTYNTTDSCLIVTIPPQSGKSQTTSRRFPLWILT